MLDTGLDNPLTALDTGFEDSVAQAEQQAADTYWVITFNTKGGAHSPFTSSTARLVEMTEQDLLKEWNDSSQLRDHFGNFENYMTYIGESQEWVQSADWMTLKPEYAPDSPEMLYLLQEDVMYDEKERDRLKDKIAADNFYVKQSAYIGWLNAGSELLEKWGLNDRRTIYNSDGDEFKWTGSGYQKTVKVDDHASFGDYAKAILKTVVTSALTYGIGQAINAGAFGSTVAEGVGKATQFVKNGLVQGLGNVPYLAPHANTIANFFFPTIQGGLGGTSDPFAILSGVTGAGAGSDTWVNAADAVNQAMGSNVIVNLANAIDNQGGYEDENGTLYSYENLPAGYIYNEAKNMVINEATGEEYPVNFSPWGGRVWLPADNGGGGATDGAPASDPNAPASGGESEGKYVVVEVNGDGTVTVKDTVDGDIWILEGDYQVGDVIPESEMTNARGAGVDPTNGPTDTDTETDDGSLPTLIPPFPETETPDDAPADPPPDEVVVDTTTDSSTDPAPTTTSSVDALCAMPRPEQYGFGQIAWDQNCGGQSEDGTTGDNDGSDASGDEGQNGTDSGGDGPGENGDNGTGDNGDGPSNANQWVDGGGASKATWTPLFPGTQFKPRRDFTKGMLSSRTPQTNFTLDDYTQQRMGLLSSAFKDLA